MNNKTREQQRLPLQEGEPVLIIEDRGRKHLLHLKSGYQSHHGRTGQIAHDDLIGKPPGLNCTAENGRQFLCLRPTLEEFILHKLTRQTQIIYPRDASIIATKGNLYCGARVLESGMGSGAFSLVARSLLGPDGLLVSYERRSEFIDLATDNIRMYEKIHGALPTPHEIEFRDIYEGIDHKDLDTIVLDLPEPNNVVQAASQALRVNGVLIAWLPTALQGFSFCRDLQNNPDWGRISTIETLVRSWRVGPQSIRPADRIVGQTGFLVSARRVAPTSVRHS